MRASKATNRPSRIPDFASREEAAEFWDTHDFTDFADELERVEMAPATSIVHIVSFELDKTTLSGLIDIARERGVEPLTLAAEWLAERVRAERQGS